MITWKIIFTTHIMGKGLIYVRDTWKLKKVKDTQLCPTLCDPHELYSSWNSPGQNTGVNSLSLLQGIIPTQGSNPCLLHYRRILYQLSHKGSPRILEWVSFPFSSRSSQPRDLHQVSCISGGFFTNWAISKALKTEEKWLNPQLIKKAK